MINPELPFEQMRKYNNRDSLLSTKLYMPHTPIRHISRDRLYRILTKGLQCKLTLVTSPPGFGKTTMVSEWVRQHHINACWVSLDTGDNDVLRFWRYVTAALGKIHPAANSIFSTLLQPSFTFSIEHIITEIINSLFEARQDIVLILDDYHQIASEEVHRSLLFFLQHLPIQIHIYVISRNDPPFPVGALRAKGQLNKIGISNLKFTKDEISHYCLQQTGVQPSDSMLMLLTDQTEGWIAGIQLAILSLQSGQKETLSHFNGNHRYIVDYLMEEVFQHLPDSMKIFLMKTAVLQRMNSDLCEAVTGYADSSHFLRLIQQSNLFLIPLDSNPYWFRYHHLFADFLQMYLKKNMPEEYKPLHEKACEWYINHGYIEEAINHALRAENFNLAVELLRSLVTTLLKRREVAILQNWLLQLPQSVVHRPDVLLILAWTEILSGRYEEVTEIVEKLHTSLPSIQCTNEALFISIREEVIILENFNALLKRDYNSAQLLMEQLAERTLPDREKHPVLLDDGIEQNFDEIPYVRGLFGFNGRINQALKYYHVYKSFIQKNNLYNSAFCAYHHTALSELYYECNDGTQALQFAEISITLAKQFRVAGAYVPAIIIKSKCEWANTPSTRAYETIYQAQNYLKDLKNYPAHWNHLLATQLIRFQLAMGDMKAVDQWMKSCSSEKETVHNNQEFELLTYMLVLLTKEKTEEAYSLGKLLVKSSQQSGRVMTELEAHLYLSEIYRKKDDLLKSATHLHQALILGERHGFLRIFSDVGLPIKLLFQQYVDMRKKRQHMPLLKGVSPQYLSNILLSIGYKHAADTKNNSHHTAHDLTKREMEVLHLLAIGLTNKEIATKLVLSEGTVKIHLNRIYSKLETKGRLKAIQKAKKLRLLFGSDEEL